VQLVSSRTNGRILWGILFNIFLITLASWWQVRSLKGFFDTRRVV
jgi:hypothetical protein